MLQSYLFAVIYPQLPVIMALFMTQKALFDYLEALPDPGHEHTLTAIHPKKTLAR